MMRRIYMVGMFLSLLATETVACVADTSFFVESDGDALIACMTGPEAERFLSERDDQLATVLHLAVATEKDLRVLEALRSAAGENWPNLRDRVDSEGRTALHVAAENAKKADSVRWLLYRGADPNAMYAVEGRLIPLRQKYGITPLHLAVERTDAADVVSALLAGDADPEIRRPPSNDSDATFTAVLIASRYAEDLRVLTALAGGGADLSEVSKGDDGALHVAAAWDRPPDVISFLLESGVDTDTKNDSGQTPLHLAALYASKRETVAMLLNKSGDPCSEDSKGRTAIDMLRAGNKVLGADGALQRQFHEICVEGD